MISMTLQQIIQITSVNFYYNTIFKLLVKYMMLVNVISSNVSSMNFAAIYPLSNRQHHTVAVSDKII